MVDAAALGSGVSQVLIDSSAFDRLSLARLGEVGDSTAVLVSPLSLYEILCHLDAPRRAGETVDPALPLRESRLGKCRSLKLLDDPLAEEGPFAAVGQWIEELLTGTAGSDVTEEARRALDEARRDYARQSTEFARALVARVGLEHALSLSALEFVRFASSGVTPAETQYEALDIDDVGLEGRLFSATYPFAGYRLARSEMQLQRMKRDGEPVFDPLDMEDAHLCLHLNLLEPIALVTARAEARNALNHALSQLSLASAALNAEVVALTAAIDVEDLLH